MNPSRPTLTGLLHGVDQPGLVARVAGWIFERGGNILHADQHRDMEAGVFFQRVEWEPGDAAPDTAAAADEFTRFAVSIGMRARVLRSSHRTRLMLFVSKADHCFHDLVLRWRAGDLAADIVGVVSNHDDLAPAAKGYGLPFHHVPVSAATKADAEARQLDILRENGAELAVLARYMQVLSPGFLEAFGAPVINIHHSFLPAFQGAQPYQRAWERGVKLIGATAHFVTEELDGGPIIQQVTMPVSHRDEVEDLARIGRDAERLALARALRLVLRRQVMVYGGRTAVFD